MQPTFYPFWTKHACGIYFVALMASPFHSALAEDVAKRTDREIETVSSVDTNKAVRIIRISDAIALTISKHPSLRTQSLQRQQQQALIQQAGIKPSPSIRVDVENLLGRNVYRGSQSNETTLSYEQKFERGQKQSLRIERAEAEAILSDVAYDYLRQDLVAKTKIFYQEVLAAQALQTLTRRRIEKEQNALQTIQQRARAGAVSAADVAKIKLRLAQSLWQLDSDQAAINNARLSLSSQWRESESFSVIGDVHSLPNLPNLTYLYRSLEDSPQLLVHKAQEVLAETRVALSRSKAKADVTVAAGFKHNQANDSQGLVMSFSMPVYWQNPYKGELDAAYTGTELVRQNYLSQVKKLHLDIKRQHQIIVSLVNNYNSQQSLLIPQAEQLLEEVEHGYSVGLYTILQWTDAQSELFKLRHSATKTALNIQISTIQLEQLAGLSGQSVVGEVTK